MSVHPSLKTKGSVGEKRNVMKRYERIDQLKKEGRYKDGDKAWGLPKTKPVELASASFQCLKPDFRYV